MTKSRHIIFTHAKLIKNTSKKVMGNGLSIPSLFEYFLMAKKVNPKGACNFLHVR